MFTYFNSKTKYGIVALVSLILTVAVIYLTPLRYTDLLEPKVVDIDPKVFNEDYLKNPDNYVFIDVRPVEAYNNNHAKGSVSMPLHTLYDTRHTLPKKDKEIIIICSGGRASGVGYSYLEHYGFTNIKRIAGGIEGWMAAGLPTEKIKLPKI